MKLTTKEKQHLKGKAHALKPIVFIGHQGITENIKTEVDRGLTDHELIKIRIAESDRDVRHALFIEICDAVFACPIQLIGSIGIVYRKNE
ncbi:hypothetical protein AYO45_00230 [Gammaproteobacteria bacterium SCGC AG-212-F23]|nr:hypothetical protein AYO45_00230 [Gammaproteobacteria bacterium SCGC AG-212-F23]